MPSVSIPNFETKQILLSGEEYSVCFDGIASKFLRFLAKEVRDYYLISGSAVLMESLRNATWSLYGAFRPHDIDIYLSWDRLAEQVIGFAESDNEIGFFMDGLVQSMERSGCGLELQCVHVKMADPDGEYPLQIGQSQRLKSLVSFWVRRLSDGRRHRTKIQLIIAKQPDRLERPLRWFIEDILSNYDINICRGSLDINTRVVSYPTDPTIFDYVMSRRFYYELRRGENYSMLVRCEKYARRGFALMGYVDMRRKLVHRVSDNSYVYFESYNPRDIKEALGIDPDEDVELTMFPGVAVILP